MRNYARSKEKIRKCLVIDDVLDLKPSRHFANAELPIIGYRQHPAVIGIDQIKEMYVGKKEIPPQCGFVIANGRPLDFSFNMWRKAK